MIMQDLGFLQIQEPAGHSKNAALSKANQGGLKGTFENVLAGFLGSQAPKSVADNQVFAKQDNVDNQEGLLEVDISEEELIASLVLIDSMQSEKPNTSHNETDLFAKQTSDKSTDFIRSSFPHQELPKGLEKKFDQIFEEVKLQNSKGFSGLSNGSDKNSWLQDIIMSGELHGKNIAEFLSMRDFVKGQQGQKESNLGRELMSILTDGNQERIKDVAATVAALRSDLAIKADPNQQVVLTDEEETLQKEIPISNAEVPKEKVVTSELVRPSVNANVVAIENLQVKEEMVFQRMMDQNLKIPEEILPEKVESKNLPKFIENQIKNSFKNGEAGTREITVKIHPEHLGKLTLKIVSDENRDMSVRILTENRNVKEFLDTNLNQLRNVLENSGIKASSFTLEIDFEKNFNQFSGSNQSNHRQSEKNSKNKANENEDLFEQQMDSIFNQSGGIEVLA